MGASSCKPDTNSTNNESIKYLDPRTKKLVRLIQKYKIDLDPHVDDNNKIDLSSNHNKLSVRNVNSLGIGGISNLNKIFKEATFTEIQELFVSGGDSDLSKLTPGLGVILKSVKRQVLFSNFKVDKKTLRMVLENSSHVETLGICFSNISKVSKKWKLDTTVNYKIKRLDLFGSCHRSWSDHLTEKKLDKLIMVLSSTKLKDSLKTVHTKEDWFAAKHLQPIFDKYGFDVTVEGDNEKPSP